MEYRYRYLIKECQFSSGSTSGDQRTVEPFPGGVERRIFSGPTSLNDNQSLVPSTDAPKMAKAVVQTKRNTASTAPNGSIGFE